jgi:DNA-binding beta-propeller fold protein YncE
MAASCIASAQTSSSDMLLVLSKKDHTVALVDPINMDVMARVPVGNDPHEVTASDDGRTAYISNYGFGAFNTLAVVDLTSRTALPSIDLGPLRGPHGLTFVGGKAWFTAEAAKAIGRYDPETHKVDWILGTGQNRTHMIYVSDDQQLILTTNVSSGTLSIITQEPIHMGPPPGMPPPSAPSVPVAGGPVGGDHTPMPDHPPIPKTDWNETVVRVGNGSEGFDISPDHKEVWVANAQDGTISVVNLADKKVAATLNANIRGANRLKFTPDGKLVLVSLLSGPDLVVLDAATRKELKRIPIGHGAAGIVMQPDGARAYVACTPDDYVAVIDLHSLTSSGRILPGGEPDGMTWVHR